MHEHLCVSKKREEKQMNNANSSQNSLLSRENKDSKIIAFLKGLPHLHFSEKGITNIVKRFGTTPEHLAFLIDIVLNGRQ